MTEYNLPFKRGWKIIEFGGGETPTFRPNADIRWGVNIDIPGVDFNWPLPIASESYEGVFAKFIIEHLSWRKVRGFIKEMHRILKPGGIAVVVTANLLEQAKKLVEAPEWNDDLICMVFGDLDYPENSHKCGFSPAHAVRLFKEAGFYSVDVFPWPAAITDMVIHAHKSSARIM